MKKLLTLLFFAFLLSIAAAQTTFRVQAGVGYIEHVSIGAGACFKNKHEVSLLYGSNLFVRPGDFSLYLLQYQRSLERLTVTPFTFHLGAKSGYGVYSDRYYRWKMICGVAYIGSDYALGNRISIFANAGVVYNRVLSVTRIEQGAIGWYKEWLPEVKTGISFKL